jgi:hypothetical protein
MADNDEIPVEIELTEEEREYKEQEVYIEQLISRMGRMRRFYDADAPESLQQREKELILKTLLDIKPQFFVPAMFKLIDEWKKLDAKYGRNLRDIG